MRTHSLSELYSVRSKKESSDVLLVKQSAQLSLSCVQDPLLLLKVETESTRLHNEPRSMFDLKLPRLVQSALAALWQHSGLLLCWQCAATP